MKRTLLNRFEESLPQELQPLLKGARIFDSSCSPEARVWYIDRDGGFYLKRGVKGSLLAEADMTRYFHKKGLGTEVLDYLSQEYDWLLTARVAGEDCTHADYLADPRRLCDTIAQQLRALHEVDFADCPVSDRMQSYFALAEENYRTGNYDQSAFPDSFGYASPQEAYTVLQSGRAALDGKVLLHGDYCLPNILLDHWRFSGFIDLGNGGVGDRHVDLFWGAWTLGFNLGTDAYRDRFFDAYGRELVDMDKIKTVAAAEVFG